MSKININTLPSGITLASESIPDFGSITVRVNMRVGGRNEETEVSGISHVLEHMAFKGTHTRTAKQIAEAIDDIGGYINAYTSKETTVYYIKSLKEDIGITMEILADILQNSLFDSSELDKEREVIKQELAQTLDNPSDLVFELFQAQAFGDTPIGRSILGTKEFLDNVSREDILQYVAKHYTTENTFITAAGGIETDQFNELTAKLFTAIPNTASQKVAPAIYQGGELIQAMDIEQVHTVLGFSGVSYTDDNHYTQRLLSLILGGGMSSRLFQEIREKRGLAYSIYAFDSLYLDAGIFGVYSSTTPNQQAELLQVIREELEKATHSISASELKRAKSQVKASIEFSQESASYRASKLASDIMIYGRYLSTQEIMQKINAITINDLHVFMQNLLNSPQTLVCLGPI